MSILDDSGIAISITIILFAFALGLPDLTFGIFGFDFSKFSPTVITVMRIGIIALGFSIGLKPLGDDKK